MTADRGAASITLDTIIAPILSEWLDFADDDDEGKEFAQAVAASVTDALLAEGEIRWDDPNPRGLIYHADEYTKPQRVLVLPLGVRAAPKDDA